MVVRREYLQKLIHWKDENVIKVVTGIRRCGKSTLLKMYKDYLLEESVGEEQIIFLNFEELENEDLLDYRSLYKYIMAKLQKDSMTYIFLDEIQKVDQFQKAVDSLYVKGNVDIYITGSNAYLLSGELATLLSGRYVEISMLPLSFKEYCQLQDKQDKDTLFLQYMRNGAFPYIATIDQNKEKIDTYLEGIYNTIILKDIEDRQRRKESDANKRRVNDLTLLRNIARFLASSVGSTVSIKKIADYIVSSGRKVSQNTINDYIEALTEAFVFYKAERYDVTGKQLLKTNHKMYIVDLGLRRYLLPKKNYDLGYSLENIIYLELLRRGYEVNVGRAGVNEVDFVAKKDDRIEYYQITASMTDENTFEREMRSLRSISDNYRKTVITLDKYTLGNYEGIEVVNAIDWLLDK